MPLTTFKIAIRQLRRHPRTTLLNVTGLTLGLAAALLLLQYVGYERSFDRFFPEAGRIYRLNTVWKAEGIDERYATTPPPLADAVRGEVPEAEAVVRVFKWSDFTMRPDHDLSMKNAYRETEVYAADDGFFDVFQYPFLAGDPATALQEPASIVMPRRTAVKYFGPEAVANGNVVGRKLMGGKDAGTPWTVTGVIEDLPTNSHLRFEFLISASTYPDDLYRNDNWAWNIMHTYVRLQPGADRTAVETKLRGLADRYAIPFSGADTKTFRAAGNEWAYPLQPLTDIHLRSDFLREMRPNGSMLYVRILALVAVLLLVIAGVNFINLATAQATRRAREVGVKKVVGAGRGRLVRQYLVESLLLGLLAGALALVLVQLAPGVLRIWLDETDFLRYYPISMVAATGLGLAAVVGLLSGLYPAFYLTWFRPVDVLKGQVQRAWGDLTLRNGLVVVQFVLSIGLIAGTLVIQQQLSLFRSKKLGFQKEAVLVIENDREIEETTEPFKAELRRHPGIQQASFSNGLPGLPVYQMRDFRLEGSDAGHGITWFQADADHLETLNLELAAGRGFEAGRATDSVGLLLNEAAVKSLGLPENPIGQTVYLNYGRPDQEKLTVLGVLRDFHLESLHHDIKPVAVTFFKGFVAKDYITVRIDPTQVESAVAHVEGAWREFEPGVPLRMHFLAAEYDQLFRSERQLGRLFGLFTGLAIVIACLGLFGLITYTVEQRTKEIGIRKILGASATGIVRLLSRDFLRLVGLAFVVAAPLAWYLMQRWLEQFAYRVELHWWVFALAGISAALIALVTVGTQALRAALAAPAEALKQE